MDRDRLLMSAKRSKNPDLFELAKQKRNAVKTAITNAHSNNYLDLVDENRGNPKKFWSVISELSSVKPNCGITNVKDPIMDELAGCQRSAAVINEYFVKIGKVLDDKLPSAPNSLTSIKYESMVDCPPTITVGMVEELVSKIDIYKSSGCGKVPMKIYKDASILCEQLTYLYNLSLMTGCIPLA